MSQTPSYHVIHWLFQFLVPYRRKVVGALLALVVGSLSWLALGQGVRLLVDQGFLSGDGQRLNQLMLLVLAINLVGGIAVFIRFYLMTWLGERVSADIRQALFQHLLQLSPRFFQATRTGEVISRFTADTTVLQTVVGMSLSMALRSLLTFIGCLLMMAITSIKLTAAVLLVVPLVLGPILFFGRKVRRLSRLSQEKVGDLGAYVDETLHEIQTVQAFSHEAIDRRNFSDRVEAVMEAASQRIRYRSGLIACVMILSVSGITLVSWLGAIDVLEGQITAGDLTAFMFYAVLAAGAVATISEVIGEIQRAAGASERLMELMNEQNDLAISTEPLTLRERCSGALTFDDVCFAYPSEPKLDVLKAYSLTIKPGERIALVGPSGAGKSTIFQLLAQFYRPQKGRILLDGVDLAHCLPEDVRQQFALVPQEPVIFAQSVLENVRYGRPSATLDEVKAACVAARADEFVSELPDGYQTELGERGARLSGGQKQRIAIARAILADRPILLLDEATSALDAANEHLVQQGLESLMEGKTTLIIAHRFSTVISCDRLVVMDKGVIQAEGTHQQLMASNALYRDLAQLQLIPSENQPRLRSAGDSP